MKITVVAVLAGLMMTVAIIATVIPPRREHPANAAAALQPGDDLAAELERCRASTAPDADCEAAWKARQQRFFGGERKGR